MTKRDFIKRIILSSIFTVIAIAIIFIFCIAMFERYSTPNKDNTSITRGTVTDVYAARGRGVVIELSNSEALQLVFPGFSQELYSSIGYDLTQLADLLEGTKIKCLRMKRLPWAVEIYAENVLIDNCKLTEKQMTVTRIGIVVIGLMALGFSISGDYEYLKAKYECYKKAEKKRAKRLNRDRVKADRPK